MYNKSLISYNRQNKNKVPLYNDKKKSTSKCVTLFDIYKNKSNKHI